MQENILVYSTIPLKYAFHVKISQATFGTTGGWRNQLFFGGGSEIEYNSGKSTMMDGDVTTAKRVDVINGVVYFYSINLNNGEITSIYVLKNSEIMYRDIIFLSSVMNRFYFAVRDTEQKITYINSHQFRDEVVNMYYQDNCASSNIHGSFKSTILYTCNEEEQNLKPHCFGNSCVSLKSDSFHTLYMAPLDSINVIETFGIVYSNPLTLEEDAFEQRIGKDVYFERSSGFDEYISLRVIDAVFVRESIYSPNVSYNLEPCFLKSRPISSFNVTYEECNFTCTTDDSTGKYDMDVSKIPTHVGIIFPGISQMSVESNKSMSFRGIGKSVDLPKSRFMHRVNSLENSNPLEKLISVTIYDCLEN